MDNNNMNTNNMTKQFHFHDTKVLITKDKRDDFYKVELVDKHGGNVKVYERTLSGALEYAKNWHEQTEKRAKQNESWGKCIEKFIEEDRKAGRSWE